MVLLLRKLKCALIEVAARQSGRKRDFANGILKRDPGERLAQQRLGVGNAWLLLRRRGRDDENDFTAQFTPRGISPGQRFEIAAPHLLVELGEFAA